MKLITQIERELLDAIKSGNLERVQQSICNGADASRIDSSTGNSVYHLIVLMPHSPNCKVDECRKFALLNAMGDINVRDGQGLTALDLVVNLHKFFMQKSLAENNFQHDDPFFLLDTMLKAGAAYDNGSCQLDIIGTLRNCSTAYRDGSVFTRQKLEQINFSRRQGNLSYFFEGVSKASSKINQGTIYFLASKDIDGGIYPEGIILFPMIELLNAAMTRGSSYLNSRGIATYCSDMIIRHMKSTNNIGICREITSENITGLRGLLLEKLNERRGKLQKLIEGKGKVKCCTPYPEARYRNKVTFLEGLTERLGLLAQCIAAFERENPRHARVASITTTIQPTPPLTPPPSRTPSPSKGFITRPKPPSPTASPTPLLLQATI